METPPTTPKLQYEAEDLNQDRLYLQTSLPTSPTPKHRSENDPNAHQLITSHGVKTIIQFPSTPPSTPPNQPHNAAPSTSALELSSRSVKNEVRSIDIFDAPVTPTRDSQIAPFHLKLLSRTRECKDIPRSSAESLGHENGSFDDLGISTDEAEVKPVPALSHEVSNAEQLKEEVTLINTSNCKQKESTIRCSSACCTSLVSEQPFALFVTSFNHKIPHLDLNERIQTSLINHMIELIYRPNSKSTEPNNKNNTSRFFACLTPKFAYIGVPPRTLQTYERQKEVSLAARYVFECEEHRECYELVRWEHDAHVSVGYGFLGKEKSPRELARARRWFLVRKIRYGM